MAHKPIDPTKNHLYYGDNLAVLPGLATASVDLVYLDPPFNSNRAYSVLFKEKSGDASQAQMEAFDDTWTWSQESEQLFIDLLNSSTVPINVKDALDAFRKLLGDNDVLAYLVMMTARLVELHRILKLTGTLWLHCDPTASHYLKILLDAIFGNENFRNEVIWQRTGSKGLMTRRLPNNHDVILCYQRSEASKWIMDSAFTPYDQLNLDAKTLSKYSNFDPDGRRYELKDITNPNPDRPNLTYEFMGVTRVWRWTKERMQAAFDAGLIVQTAPGRVPRIKRYLDEQRGKPFGDVWTDIPPINSQAAERLGYPTQKPLALLERILQLSSEPDDVVLDPFCGCGTAVDAAEKLGRRWIGIDITTLAVDLIDARLRHTYGEKIRDSYEILGIPKDVEGAHALFNYSHFEFERWCVMQLDGQPNEKQVGDKGVDGVIRFPLDAKGASARVLVSVKGGATGPAHVRELGGTVINQNAAMGVFICMETPTKKMLEEAQHSGIYTHPANGQTFPKVQIISVPEILAGKRPTLPPVLLPYFQAPKREVADTSVPLF